MDPELPQRLGVVRDESGEVIVGTVPAAPAGLSVVRLPGSLAYVDPTAPDVPAAVVVSDQEEAAPVLARLFGPGVAEQVQRAGDDPAPAVAFDTESGGRLARYGVLRWLWTTAALPLDRITLAAECAVAAEEVEDLLDPEEPLRPDPADLAPLAVAAARGLRAGGGDGVLPELRDLVTDLLDAAGRRLPPAGAWSQDVRHEAEVLAALSATGATTLDWDRWEALLEEATPRGAADLGSGEGQRRQGSAPVDWARVPPGVVSTSEGAVQWRVTPVEGDRLALEVQVLADQSTAVASGMGLLAAGEPDAAAVMVALRQVQGVALRLRVYSTAFGLPLAGAQLHPTRDGQWFTARVTVPAGALGAGSLVLDVHGDHVRGAPRSGDLAVAAEAARWAARGTGLLRLALADGDPTRAGLREPWERARQLFATVAAGDDQVAALAVRQQARCEAVLLRCLEAAGLERPAQRRRRSLEALAARVRPDDLVLPDLTTPGWSPTVAELGLLASEQAR